jgi:RNA polymerase sigma factor (sigma-70 family)
MRSPDDIHDEWLIIRCQDGDAAALGELVERWQPRLMRHALRLTGRADAAADVVQTAWIAIIRGLAGLNDPACFRRWAYRIVGFKSADWVRTRQRQRAETGPMASEPTDSRESLDQSQETRDDIATLRTALKRLSLDQRTILSMFYVEEMSLTEIAQSLALPLGTVKSRLHYARLALKEILERRNP